MRIPLLLAIFCWPYPLYAILIFLVALCLWQLIPLRRVLLVMC